MHFSLAWYAYRGRIVLVIFALMAMGIAHLDQAGEPIHPRNPATVQVLRDNNGDALRFGDRQTTLMSTNWSGYVLSKFETKQKYTSATATWIVPAVSFADAPVGFTTEPSSSWVGIGGYCKNAKCRHADRKLIQLGTEQDANSDGTTIYYTWYEMLPAFSVQTPLAVSPGDTITASLICSGKCNGRQSWTLSLTNNTTGLNWSQVFTYEASKLSAEWIEEAPSSFSGVLDLTNFGTASFSNCTYSLALGGLPHHSRARFGSFQIS